MMRLATAAALAALALLAAPVAAQVCPVTFTTANYPSVEGAWSVTETEDRLFDNLLGLCGADAEDFGTSLANGCLLEASGGALVCGSGGGGGSPLEVREVDASPSVASVTQLAFDQTDGFVVSTGGTGLARVDLTVPDDSHAHTGTTISGLAAGDTTSGAFDPARLPAATTSAQGAVELATSGESAANVAVQGNDPRLSDSRTPTAHAASHVENASDEVFGENLGTACADGEILKANATGGLICGSAGSAAFTTLDADYGDETVTSAWDLAGAKIEAPNSTTPPTADCDAAGEAGRVYVDTDAASGQQWCVCEGVAGWNCGGSGGGSPEGDQYHPDRLPASCAVCEEWENDTASLAWEWFNQDAASEVVEMDGATLTGEATGDEARGRAVDPPSAGNVDFTVTAKVHFYAGSASACGIGILDGGTLAAPTNVVYTYSSQGSLSFNDATSFDFGTASGLWGGIFPAASATWTGGSYCVQLRYVDSTRVVRAHWAKDCHLFREPAAGSTTLSNDPIKVFYFTRDSAICHVQWFRIRTDADRNFAGE